MASYAEDAERLPYGFQRVGYDADSQITYYKDRRGRSWQSPPGNEYGQLMRVPSEPQIMFGAGDRSSLLGRRMNSIQESRRQWRSRRNSYSQPRQAEWWRYFAPFALLIILFMGLMIWFVRSPSDDQTSGRGKQMPASCSSASEIYVVKEGDTCWAIAKAASIKVGELVDVNPNLDCDSLHPGQQICVPES